MALLAVAAVAVGVGAASPMSSSARSGASGWSIVPSPALAGGELLGVAALSSTDAWAVGTRAVNGAFQPLAEHWDGSSWAAVPVPSQSSFNELYGVTMVSSSDVWAVGVTANWAGLIEHWDGSSWKVVASPNSGTQTPVYSVVGFAPDNVWAVGENGQNGTILHFDGAAWTAVRHPEPAGASLTVFSKVAGLSPRSIWVVGESQVSTQQTIVEHFNGTRWKIVPSADQGSYNYVRGLSVRTSGDAWLVGDWEGPGPTYDEHPLVQHWNGTAWTAVSSPTGQPWAVAALSGTDAWLVGNQGSGNAYSTLLEHWDGTGWSVVSGPNTGSGDSELNGLAEVPDGSLWAVGSYSPGGPDQPLIERNPSG